MHVHWAHRWIAAWRTLFPVLWSLFLNLLRSSAIILSLDEKSLNFTPSLVAKYTHCKLKIIYFLRSPPSNTIVGILRVFRELNISDRRVFWRFAHLLARLNKSTHRTLNISFRCNSFLFIWVLIIINIVSEQGRSHRTFTLVALLLILCQFIMYFCRLFWIGAYFFLLIFCVLLCVKAFHLTLENSFLIEELFVEDSYVFVPLTDPNLVE